MFARTFLTVFASFLACCSGVVAWGQNDGRVSHVTLYRSQAMVTRTIKIEGDAGNSEVVVGKLPENIVADSLFAEGSADIEVRAVQFRTRAVGDSPREEVRQLQDEIQGVQDQIELNQKNLEITNRQVKYLDQLEGFVAPTATTESATRRPARSTARSRPSGSGWSSRRSTLGSR